LLSALALGLLLMGQESQAMLQSCVLEAEGWVCRYRVPDTILRPDGEAPAIVAPPLTLVAPSYRVTPPPSPPAAEPPPEAQAATTNDEVSPAAREAVRQAKLIRRCADASWLSLCTPGDRREAKALQEAAAAREALARDVTALAAKGDCEAAVRTALEGGDLTLAREIRDFCESAPARP